MIADIDLIGLSALVGVSGTTIALLYQTFHNGKKLNVAHDVAQSTAETIDRIEQTSNHLNYAVNGIEPGQQTIRENVQELVAGKNEASGDKVSEHTLVKEGLSQMVAKFVAQQEEDRALMRELREALKVNGKSNGTPPYANS